MTLYEKVQDLCKKEGFEISNLGDKLGIAISRGSISKWKNGAVPRASTVKAIADYFGVTVAYLMGKEESESNLYERFGFIPVIKRKIPMLGEISCGKPIFANEDRENYVRAGTDIDADFCLRAKGDSMIGARIMDGDIVFVKSTQSVYDGEIAVVIIEDEATLKRVYYDQNEGKLILQAENPKYRPLVYIGEELNQIRILGRAIAFQSDVR